MRVLDISIPVRKAMVHYPGDPRYNVRSAATIDKDGVAISMHSFGSHTGTHIDAPAHFIPGGATIDKLDLDIMVGPVWVADFTKVERCITAADLQNAEIPPAVERILLKTRNSGLWSHNEFSNEFVFVATDAAQWLVDFGIRLVGIDYLSVEAFPFSEPTTHKILLGSGLVILESVNLHAVVPQQIYTLLCLPLNLVGADGAPARVGLLSP